jgi:hypothetical protein
MSARVTDQRDSFSVDLDMDLGADSPQPWMEVTVDLRRQEE